MIDEATMKKLRVGVKAMKASTHPVLRQVGEGCEMALRAIESVTDPKEREAFMAELDRLMEEMS